MITNFSVLTPDRVLDAVEAARHQRCSGILRPLPSYINRVYDVELESGEHIVAKFYRPGRWSREALLNEHAFVRACAEAEIPVIAPLLFADGTTLAEVDAIAFALFPKRGGRPIEPADPGDALWHRLGALLARIHCVGERELAPARLTFHPAITTAADLDYLLSHDFLEPREAKRLEQFGTALLETIEPLFNGVETIRLHGDCQHTNVLERPDTGIFLIDFDDMMNGPPVQDLWMLLPGRREACPEELDQLLEGYTMFRAFDRRTLALIEPLRAMRMTYYLAWCAQQAQDVSFLHHHPGWGSPAFWAKELHELDDQLRVIHDDLEMR